MILSLLLQVGVPFALVLWQSLPDRSGAAWLLKTLISIGYISATALAGLWLVAPWYLSIAFLLASAAMAALMCPRPFRLFASLSSRERIFQGARVVAAAVVMGVVWASVESRRPPANLVDLTFPLHDGTYYIANGGSTGLTNAHRLTPGPLYWKYRGQGYGVDIVKLNAHSRRANGWAPSDPYQYEIFGDAVFAPCEGVVLRVEDWLTDLNPPDVDRVHPPGNFVLIECEAAIHVVVAHLRSETVTVHPGDYVTTDTVLGEVGNSGNSTEPHLHIHAQRPGRIWDPFIGDPLPIRLDGRYPVRNDRFTNVQPFIFGDEDEID
jgi:hypothetical protein